jgi:hypothetical protein
VSRPSVPLLYFSSLSSSRSPSPPPPLGERAHESESKSESERKRGRKKAREREQIERARERARARARARERGARARDSVCVWCMCEKGHNSTRERRISNGHSTNQTRGLIRKKKKAANTPLSCTLTKPKQGLTHELKKACAKHELN